jgi:hypothetical protein
MIRLTTDFAQSFSQKWIAAWNSHNLEDVLDFYSEDCIIESPLAAIILPQSHGRLAGKEAVRAYWTLGLKQNPDLEFKLLDFLPGIGSLAIYYENVPGGKRAVEILVFNEEGKVGKTFVYKSV